MKKIRFTSILLKPFIQKNLARFKFKITMRLYAFIIAILISLLSITVIGLEILPSYYLVETNFAATLETQNLTFRNGPTISTISGISGSRISLREKKIDQISESQDSFDITKLSDVTEADEQAFKDFLKDSEESYLELDSFIILPERVVEVSTSGKEKFISLQVVEDQNNARSEIIIVWNGSINSGPKAVPSLAEIGREKWEAVAPLIEIERPQIDGLIYSPIKVSAVSTEQLRLSGKDRLAVSSLLQGEIQFYVGSYPTQPFALRAGETIKFDGLNARLANLELTENGLRFVLVGQAEAVRTGLLTNLRDITPSILDWLRSIQSFVIILSSLSALLLAALSAVSLRRDS